MRHSMYLVDMSEHQLYFYAQAGVTLFRDIYDNVFDDNLLALNSPNECSPFRRIAPRDLVALFDKEVDEIVALLAPGRRRKMDAIARARSLAVLESAVQGDYEQSSAGELTKVCQRLAGGDCDGTSVFPGVASINISTEADEPCR